MIFELKVLLIGITLAIASYHDVKTREIEDKIWLIAGAIGAALTAYEIMTTPNYPLILASASIALTVLLAFGIFYLGLYGGADAKALTAIAVTMPLSYLPVNLSPFFPFTVLGNSLILSLMIIPACLIWNLSWLAMRKPFFEGLEPSLTQKIVAIFTGVRVKPKTAKSIHFNLMEKIDKQGKHFFKLFSRITDEEDIKIIDEKSPYVWVTPAIPMIIFFLIGFFASFVAGDFIFRLVYFFMNIF